MKFLHFTDNDQFDPETHEAPKLKKIYEIFQAINAKFQNVYIPNRDLSIDESLVLYKGHLKLVGYRI